jgi:HlyD family secretion protein
MLRAGAPVATLLLEEDPWIIVYVPEGDLARVSVGQQATVTPDGIAPLAGQVTWISRRAEYTPRNVQTQGERVTQVFAVKVVVPAGAAPLKDGMWADVRFR